MTLSADLADAVRIKIRYDLPDEKGETRDERNERFGVISGPPLVIPEAGFYLWEWFWDISNSLRRVWEGVAIPIPPSEFLAWRTITENIVYPYEYDILREMDRAFCESTNVELDEYRARTNPPPPETGKRKRK